MPENVPIILQPSSYVEKLPVRDLFVTAQPRTFPLPRGEGKGEGQTSAASPQLARVRDRLGPPSESVSETDKPLEVELGAGDGSFLAAWAAQNPARNFLAVERLLGRLRKTERKIRRAGLTNVRLLRIEAGYFLEYMLPAGSVAALHVYFPDPWPKRKHHRHRLINDHFTEVTATVLQPGGIIYLRTDDEPYFTQMTAAFGRNKAFQPIETPPDLKVVLTDFERDFQARGVSTNHAAYRRC